MRAQVVDAATGNALLTDAEIAALTNYYAKQTELIVK